MNLPNGYTVHEGYGAWMNPITHKTIREATVILRVALPDTPDSLAAVNRIRTEYQVRFRQELVGMTVTQAAERSDRLTKSDRRAPLAPSQPSFSRRGTRLLTAGFGRLAGERWRRPVGQR